MNNLSKEMFEKKQGWVWFWRRNSNGKSGFFLGHSFRTSKKEAYKWAYENYGKKGLTRSRKRGLGIMRVRFLNDGWSR